MANKLARVVTYNEELPVIQLHDHVTNSTCPRPMAIKHSKAENHRQGLLSLNSYNPVNMWYVRLHDK